MLRRHHSIVRMRSMIPDTLKYSELQVNDSGSPDYVWVCYVDFFSNWFLQKFRYPSPSDLDFSDGMASEAGKARVVLWKIILVMMTSSYEDRLKQIFYLQKFNNVMTLAFYVAPWYLAESKALKFVTSSVMFLMSGKWPVTNCWPCYFLRSKNS